jgi:hypothetical protein
MELVYLHAMNTQPSDTRESVPRKFRLGCFPVLGIVAAVIVVTALLTAWWMKHNIYASKFTPTELTAREQQALDSKLARLEASSGRPATTPAGRPGEPDAPLEPERYTEEGAKREISLNERELNALIANQPEIAQRVAIDLSDNLMSVKLVVPMDEEILFLGGKTLRLNLGVSLNYENGQPVVALQGMTLGGIPLPNAWLGNMKYKNLVNEFGTEGGFWKLFADGVEDIKVRDGHIQIRLKE